MQALDWVVPPSVILGLRENSWKDFTFKAGVFYITRSAQKEKDYRL